MSYFFTSVKSSLTISGISVNYNKIVTKVRQFKGRDTSRTLKKSSFFQFYSGRMKTKQVRIFCIYQKALFYLKKYDFFMIEKYKMAEIWRISSIVSLLTFFAAVNFLHRKKFLVPVYYFA